MKRAVLALLATAAGLMFILTFRPASVTADLTAPTVIVPSDSGKPPLSEKFFMADKFSLKDKVLLQGTPFSDSAGVALAGLPDGTYTGDQVQIPGGHGPLQVTLTVQGGRVTTVEFAHEPTSVHSEQISGHALPMLRDALLASQQGPVDVVSGATAVSEAFNQSLLTAVD
jgi:uncharacterized protein with FMN-binding domain